jgi:HSP20 family protein
MVSQRRSNDRSLDLQGDFDYLTAHVEHLWRQLLQGDPNQPQYSPAVLKPPVDVFQTPDGVVVIVEIPGVRDQELHLDVEPNRIIIRGEKRNRQCADAHGYSRMEITCGSFARVVDLPVEIDPDGTSVSYDDGYVEIRLPRMQRRLERRVHIRVQQP